MAGAETIHATCVVLHDAGVLIRGGSGSGKTGFALALMDRAASTGFHTGLVGDDRVRLEARHGRLVAWGHPAVAGLVEIRGHGIRRVTATHAAAVVRLVVDIVAEVRRLPDAVEETTDILGIGLRCVTLGSALPDRGLAVRIVLDFLDPRSACVAARTHPAILAPWDAQER